MRFFVVILAVLAGLKVWTQDRLYRSAMSDALVAAYRDRAAQGCFKISESNQAGKLVKPVSAPLNPWAPSADTVITIGNPRTDVAMLDFDNPLWDVRYRHPHLVLAAPTSIGADCSYDMVTGLARIANR